MQCAQRWLVGPLKPTLSPPSPPACQPSQPCCTTPGARRQDVLLPPQSDLAAAYLPAPLPHRRRRRPSRRTTYDPRRCISLPPFLRPNNNWLTICSCCSYCPLCCIANRFVPVIPAPRRILARCSCNTIAIACARLPPNVLGLADDYATRRAPSLSSLPTNTQRARALPAQLSTHRTEDEQRAGLPRGSILSSVQHPTPPIATVIAPSRSPSLIATHKSPRPIVASLRRP